MKMWKKQEGKREQAGIEALRHKVVLSVGTTVVLPKSGRNVDRTPHYFHTQVRIFPPSIILPFISRTWDADRPFFDGGNAHKKRRSCKRNKS